MSQSTHKYTRFVSFLKIVLPLIGIALLATVFLFTRDNSIEGGLRFSKADLESLETGISITNPRFSGSNVQGDTYDFSAKLVLPDAPKPTKLLVSGMSGEISFVRGNRVELSAQQATIEIAKQTLQFTDGVNLVFSNGLRINTQSIMADLAAGEITTGDTITASSPMGNIEAGNLRVETLVVEGNEEKRMIWFENGVKLDFNMANTLQD